MTQTMDIGKAKISDRRAACCALLVALALMPAASMPAVPSGERAPAFTLPTRGGKAIDLARYKGQVVMLNFWASWCAPCRKEMPLLDGIYKKYKPMGFTLVGVNVEPDPKAADALLKDVPVSFPIAYDTKSQVSKLYRIAGMPSTVIIDRKGKMRVLHKGYRPGDENKYLDHVRALIRE